MKQTVAILLAFFYLLPTIGYSIDVHWCGKKVAAVSLSPVKSSPKCSVCSKPRSCCKTTHTVVKLKDVQHISAQVKVLSSSVFSINLPVVVSEHIAEQSGYINLQYYHPPPFTNGVHIHIVNSIFRI